METGEIFALAAILIGILAILVAIFALMWQVHSQGNKLNDRASDVETRLDVVEFNSERTADMETRLGAIELSNARLEGINESLNEILRRQSHTHESNSPAAAD